MDTKCVVCGEPWDSYGVAHGDMLPWEAKLFRAGAGCPSCKGEPNGHTIESFEDIENGDEDPMHRIIARERFERGEAPKWERPCDEEHWVCDGCGVRVVTNQDTGNLEYDVRWGAKCRDWYHSHDFDRGEPTKEPAHTFEHGGKVCEFCLSHCAECGTELCSHLDFGDVYDEGNPLPDPRDEYHSVVCIECLGIAEEEAASNVWRTCYTPSNGSTTSESIATTSSSVRSRTCCHASAANTSRVTRRSHYSDPERESDAYSLPDVEVFHASEGELWDGTDDRGNEPNEAGWYYWFCFPGCMPDSDAFGPFETEQAALDDAREVAS